MRYFIFSKNDNRSLEIKKILADSLLKLEFEEDESNPEIVFTIGGDGTILRAIHKYIYKLEQISFVGIHSGKLGFYCDYTIDEIDILLDDLKRQEYKIEKIYLLQAQVDNEIYYGLNEIRIESPFTTFRCLIKIDNQDLEHFRGNGLNFATTFGSTAYNRSLGGPIIENNLECIVMQEVAGINHNIYHSLNSPLVLDKAHQITLEGSFKRAVIGFDHRYHELNDGVNSLTISLSERCVQFIRMRQIAYFERLKRSFITD